MTSVQTQTEVLRDLINEHYISLEKIAQGECGLRSLYESAYITLSVALPEQCAEGSRFVAAKEYCLRIGLSEEMASEISALYFALNPGADAQSTEPLDAEFGDLSLKAIAPDVSGFVRALLSTGITLDEREAICLYILLACNGEHQSEEEARSIENAMGIVDKLFAGLKVEIEQNSAVRSLSELPKVDTYYLPTSKVFWSQRKIAAAGGGTGLRVDSSEKPLVMVAIRSTDGNPLDITPSQTLLQIVIYQMVRKAGCPMTVSLDQICREYISLCSSKTASVSDETRRDVEKWMDELIFKTDATLDYTQQVEVHGLKKKHPDYDYSKTSDRSALIVGVKHTDSLTTYHGHSIDIAYTIYDAPLMCRYSELVTQVAAIPIEAIAPVERKGLPAMRLSTRSAVIRNALVRHIERIRSTKATPPRILLQTLVEECSNEALSEKQTRLFRETTQAILDDFKTGRYIKEYTPVYAGRAVKGFDVKLSSGGGTSAGKRKTAKS